MTRIELATVTALGIFLGLPIVARAEVLLLDYEGAVTSIDEPDNQPGSSGYTIGEPVKGQLTIDLQRVMPPLGGQNTDSWEYRGFPTGEQDFLTNFVNGFFGPESEQPISGTDRLIVRNYPNGSGTPDSYFVEDNDDWGKGLTLDVEVDKHDLLQDTGIVQSFDLRPEDVRGPGESITATIWAGADEFFVHAALSHVSLRSCEPHT